MRKLIVLSAPSGAGKTTLCLRLLRDFPELTLSVSSTTRAPRGQEKHGKEYYFLSREEFEKDLAAGHFAEWALVHGNYYGTSKKTIEQAFAQGKAVLLDIDVQGAASLRKAYPQECFTVFIATPDFDELEKRLRARGTDSEQNIQRRLTNAREELKEARHFHKTIVNDDLDRAYSELSEVIRKVLHG